MKITCNELADIIYNETCKSSCELFHSIEDLIEYLYENNNKSIEIPNPYVGTKLYGFCNGYFGRDSYEDKVIEYIGEDYIVARDSRDVVLLAYFNNRNEIEYYIKKWSDEDNEYE